MTYQEQIEWLQKDSMKKSEAYISTLNEKRKNPQPADRSKIYKEWEAAEYAYTNFLIAMKMQKVNLSDRMAG